MTADDLDRRVSKISLFLANFVPLSVSLDAIIKKKLKRGKFPLTKTGWVKFIAMLLCIAALSLFLAQPWDASVCPSKPSWYLIVFPVCLGLNLVVEFALYLVFSCGGAVKAPGKWVKADILLNLCFSVVGIIGSIMTIVGPVTCVENKTTHQVPGIVGVVGSVLSIIGCAAIFLMYRNVQGEESEYFEEASRPETTIDYRKSMQA